MCTSKKKKKKKSVTTRCAFFSFYKYREGYKFRKVTDTSRNLLNLSTVEQNTCYWSEFTLIFIANIFIVFLRSLCDVVQLNYMSVQLYNVVFVHNKNILCNILLRCGSFTVLHSFFRRFCDEWTLQYTVQIIVNLKKEAKIGGGSTSVPHNNRKSKEVFLISAKPSSLW